MIRRRARDGGPASNLRCHTIQETGITAYLSRRGSLEHAQQIAHALPSSTTIAHTRSAWTRSKPQAVPTLTLKYKKNREYDRLNTSAGGPSCTISESLIPFIQQIGCPCRTRMRESLASIPSAEPR